MNGLPPCNFLQYTAIFAADNPKKNKEDGSLPQRYVFLT
jgi:hypothetical protein